MRRSIHGTCLIVTLLIVLLVSHAPALDPIEDWPNFRRSTDNNALYPSDVDLTAFGLLWAGKPAYVLSLAYP